MPKSINASAAKRMKLKDGSVTAFSNSTSRSRKTKGKMTRSNQQIGNLTIEAANELASRITGYYKLDLALPYRCEADAALSKKWISTFDEEDVVIHRKLCLICLLNPMDAFFKSHVAQVHPEVSPETTEVMRRLSDVRYSRFCQNSYVHRESIQELFPTILPVKLVNFLAGLGFDFCNTCSSSRVKFEETFEEPDVRGVRKDVASEILKLLRSPKVQHLEEIQFSAEVVTNSRMLDPSTQTKVHCYICDKVCNKKNFSRHMLVHGNFCEQNNHECSLEDVAQIFTRITEVRTAMYYAAQPVNMSIIAELSSDAEVQRRLVDYLLDAGFVVTTECETQQCVLKRSLSRRIIIVDPDSSDMPALLSMARENEEDHEDLEEFDPEIPRLSRSDEMDSDSSKIDVRSSRSRSSSVTSESSSVSSTSSTSSRIVLGTSSCPSEEPFPYCVLNAIPEHVEVEHALFDLLETMTDDMEFRLNQSQFGFLLGYTMYCLVVANGSKQNVISRLTQGDFRNAKTDEQSGLHYFSFSSQSTCTKADTREYLCADERIWRALEIFEVARERRIDEKEWTLMKEDSAPFFFSYVSPAAIVKDTNYWMCQFLRKCGVDWPCRSSAICSAAWSLVARDSSKASHQQYAITYFQLLREKERSQIQLLDDGLSGHPTYMKISSQLSNEEGLKNTERMRKKQKRYRTPERIGVPNKPRGGDHKSRDFLIKTGREVPAKMEEEFWRKQRRKEKQDDLTTKTIDVEEQETLGADGNEILCTTSQCSERLESSNNSHSSMITHHDVHVEGDLIFTCL